MTFRVTLYGIKKFFMAFGYQPIQVYSQSQGSDHFQIQLSADSPVSPSGFLISGAGRTRLPQITLNRISTLFLTG